MTYSFVYCITSRNYLQTRIKKIEHTNIMITVLLYKITIKSRNPPRSAISEANNSAISEKATKQVRIKQKKPWKTAQ